MEADFSMIMMPKSKLQKIIASGFVSVFVFISVVGFLQPTITYAVDVGTLFGGGLTPVGMVYNAASSLSSLLSGATTTVPDPQSGCYFTSPSTWIGKCFLNPILSQVGLMFLTVGGAVLELAGLLFDTLIQAVITGFGSTLSNLGIIAAITTGWDAFRDLSNILIIGMFVFIAICTILGSKEYGYKKLVARVLIIAVLMNFSLLFTKLIIDVSNFTAFQFYNQIAGQGQGSTPAGQFDVAQAFLQPMGITSVWQTNPTGSIVGYTAQQTGSGWQALLVGMIGGVLLIVVAVVLFYGVVLIGARAIVLIILMVTSAVAFATYLIPNFAGSKYGWKGWWEALINCAVFAPLLMLFLSISVNILNGVSAVQQSKVNLGSIISDPAQLAAAGSTGWEVVITYLIAIGLLFVSLKISSQFASATSGMNLTMSAIMSPLAVGGRLVGIGANSLGRRYIGQPASSDAITKKEEARRARSELKDLDIRDPKFKIQADKLAQLEHEVDKATARAKNPGIIGGARVLMKQAFPKPEKKNAENKDVTAKPAAPENKNAVPRPAAPEVKDAAAKKAGEVEKAATANKDVAAKPVEAGTTPRDEAGPAPLTAAPAPVATSDDTSKIRDAIDGLTQATKESAQDNSAALKNVSRTVERSATPVTTTAKGIEDQQRNAEAAKQNEESKNRERFNEQKSREENALQQVTEQRIASHTAMDDRLASAQTSQVSQARVVDMLKRVAERQRDNTSETRNNSFSPDVVIIPPPVAPEKEHLEVSTRPPVNIPVKGPYPPAPPRAPESEMLSFPKPNTPPSSGSGMDKKS